MQASSNYLYIIVAVVYVVYNVIKAGKKVTQNRPTVNKNPEPSPTVRPPTASPLPEDITGVDLKKMLEDLLTGGTSEQLPEKQVLKPKPQVVSQKPKPVKTSSSFIKKDKPGLYQSKPKEPVQAPVFVSHPEIVQKGFAEPVTEAETSIDFDIRQAIIYSEILKRPQY